MQGCFLSSQFCKVINVSKVPPAPFRSWEVEGTQHLWTSGFSSLGSTLHDFFTLLLIILLWYLDRDTCTDVLDKLRDFFVPLGKPTEGLQSNACLQAASTAKKLHIFQVVGRLILPSASDYLVWHSIL